MPFDLTIAPSVGTGTTIKGGFGPGAFPHAEMACDEVLSLPMHPELAPEAVDQVAAAIREFVV